MNLLCPNCQKTLTVPEQFAGQLMKCPLCSGTFTVPALPPAGEPAPAEPSEPSRPAAESAPAFAAPPLSSPEPAFSAPAEPAFKTASPTPAAATASSGPRQVSLHLREGYLKWIPPAALLIVFVLHFFPWLGIYPGGVPAVTQNAWGAAFNLTPYTDPDMKELFSLPAEVEKNLTVSPLILFYLFPTFLVTLAFTLFVTLQPIANFKVPPQVQQLLPWKYAILAGLNALLLLFLVLQLLLNFSLESAYTDLVYKKYESQAAGSKTHELKKVEAERGMELQKLRRTVWLRLSFVLHLLAAGAAGLVYWLEKRGPDAPTPVLEWRW